MKTVVLGVTGSVAVFKVIDLIDLLKNKGWDVHVIMTCAATQMVPAFEFEKATGNPVYTDLFEEGFDYKKVLESQTVDHIELAKKADVFVVIPATANTIAKIAYGIADNFLTTSLLATKAPVVICPAMNTFMWENPATKRNITTLRSFGYYIVEPTSGMLACGYEGKGKLENINEITKVIDFIYENSKKLAGKKILITAGATRESVDDVRFITNASTGKMGKAIAEEAYFQGSEVLLLRAENAIASKLPIKQKTFTTSGDLSRLIKKYAKSYNYIFHTAAVGDFSILNKNKGKLSSEKEYTITLKPQEKIINTIKQTNPKIHLIGFKAEHGLSKDELTKRAHEKLQTTKADMIVANDVAKKGRGFASDTNEVIAVFPDGTSKHVPLAPKNIIARELLSLVF